MKISWNKNTVLPIGIPEDVGHNYFNAGIQYTAIKLLILS
jgi:hypothetical protein